MIDYKNFKKISMKQNKLLKPLKNNKGSAGAETISILAMIFICLSLLVLFMTFFGAYIKTNRVTTMAGEIMRIAEIKGTTDIETEITHIIENSGIQPEDVTVTFECDYISGTKRVQLGSNMSVTVTTVTKIGVGNIAVLDIPLIGKATGISEQYWK